MLEVEPGDVFIETELVANLEFEKRLELSMKLPDEVEVIEGILWLIPFDEAVAMVVAVVEE